MNKIKIQQSISNKGYPTNNKCYTNAHKKANEAEIEKYGKKRFDELNTLINKILPKGELAGSHTKNGIIKRSDKIPKKYWKQIDFHEEVEINNMEGC